MEKHRSLIITFRFADSKRSFEASLLQTLDLHMQPEWHSKVPTTSPRCCIKKEVFVCY